MGGALETFDDDDAGVPCRLSVDIIPCLLGLQNESLM
jgi:hypothetical protein